MIKIKLGFVVNNLVVGGVSKVLLNLCNQLDSSVYDIHLISLSSDLEMKKIIPLKSNIKVHVFDYDFVDSYSLWSYLKTAFIMGQTLRKAKTILNLIRHLELDILHFHTLPRQLVIGQLAEAQNPNLKLVYTDHGVRISNDDRYKLYQKTLLLIAYRKFYNSYHLIAVSKAVFDSISQNSFNEKNRSLELLENSIPLNDYHRDSDISKIGQQYIYISRMNTQKGHDTLIRAWKKIKNLKKGKLIIVGPDETNGKFHKMAEGEESIELTGSVSNVKDYLNQSTIGLFPSQKEGLPIALLEMMAFQLPIICSNIFELTSIIEDQKEGLHFKLDDVDDLRSKIEFSIENPILMKSMGEKARLKVEAICKANDPIEFHNRYYSSIL